ncbi:MAG: diguanylate cyclase [Synergistaceae bacterium]|nr:diguanylate cyclase [Synergistaceae bacterium]
MSEDASNRRRDVVQYSIELEKELMKVRRSEKVLREMERRYLTLMESSVFLHVVLGPNGTFRMMNRRAESFFGFQLKTGVDVALYSLVGSGYEKEAESAMAAAANGPNHVVLPAIRADGSLGWLDMEFSPASYQGEPAVLVLAADVSGLLEGRTEGMPFASLPDSEVSPAYALPLLNCCPGLLCFAVNRKGLLLYSTRGYREIAKRFLEHECAPGFPYPVSLETPFDMELQDLIHDALQGGTRMSALVEKSSEGNNRWNVTAAPLVSATGVIMGAVVHLTAVGRVEQPETPKEEAQTVSEKPEVQSPPEQGGSEKIRERQAELLNAMPRPFCLVDEEGLCAEVNDRFLGVLKLTRDEVVGQPFANLSDDLGENLAERFLQAIGAGISFEGLEWRVCAKDGEVFFWEISGFRVRWGDAEMILVSCADQTKLRRAEEQLVRLSIMDVSTGVLNRQGMERVINEEIGRAALYRSSLSLLLLNVDGFRRLNAEAGHTGGDRAMRDLAAGLKSRVRQTDFLGRWGGDEFVILTPVPLAAAARLAETLLGFARNTSFEGNSLTLSAGVAEFGESMNISAVTAAAYEAMTEAKRTGGDRVVQVKKSGKKAGNADWDTQN